MVNRSSRDVSTKLGLRLAADLAEIERVKAGLPSEPVRPGRTPDGLHYGNDQVMVDVVVRRRPGCSWTMPGRWRSGTSCWEPDRR